jgi:hypothetical protein
MKPAYIPTLNEFGAEVQMHSAGWQREIRKWVPGLQTQI